jgi:hypothetical protein
VKRWRYALLFFELFLFALILILPQVDLPDFTFPGSTAPIVAKARLSSTLNFSANSPAGQALSLTADAKTGRNPSHPGFQLNLPSPISVRCILRC